VKIANDSVVELDYRLHLGDGEVIDQSSPGDPLSYLHGHGQIVPGLEKELAGMTIGDQKKVVVPPAGGYGDVDPEAIEEVPLTMFPPGVKPTVGMRFTASGPQGDVPVLVTEVKSESAVVDCNHPLAGKTLHFDVTVRAVRAATKEELAHGHAHGADGHEH
jgi:FKBP-type peptidyl-prolyl cis-trans isomerase SlyD